MKGKKARIALGMAICLSASALAGCGAKEGNTEGGSTPESSSAVSGSGTASEGKPVKLTMLGWEIYQQAGMEALAEAYHEEHPNVTIEVQISTWSEYWTKLEAMANSGSLPDIFWMHTNEFSKYADAGMLAELTDLYDEEDKDYFKNNFPDNLVGNFTYDDKIYGIPKDVDTVALVYNKDIFDEAGVAYPDDTWTWDTLVEVSETIKEKTGKYGMLADDTEQEGWLNTIYQAGGFYISEDKTKAGFEDEGTKKGLKEYIGWQTEHDFSPNQKEFSDLGRVERFVAGEGAMMNLGSWGINNLYINYPDLNWDVAVLPKCPDPVKGDGRASISNGLAYATAADNPNLDVVKDVLKFLGTKEAAVIHGENGAAIPAFNNTGDSWANNYEGKNVKAYVDQLEYSVQFPYSKSKSAWYPEVEATLLEVYSGNLDLDKACEQCQQVVDENLAAE
ncbi:ABC transporter substrate-binding protein [Novisyntrophococcus fermenticellae]|uniref:ABC transporter substrate-binding protein n=1 Tax=Novisyntrophococcus fermenticellae TaxID=2068655 RepID=UPI001E58CC35|nr:sugar ABC transporter substrate-binding protein [Novisyntrophococcus fermenticellae]